MKKTIWQPVLLGIAFGLLAGASITAGLSFVVSNSLTTGVIGFHVVFVLLSASIGGPLAGFITPAICVILIILFGDSKFVEFLSKSYIFWTNMIVPGMVMALASIGYRLVFGRVKMPARLLPWAGIVIATYVINSPTILSIQYYFANDELRNPSVCHPLLLSILYAAVDFRYLHYFPDFHCSPSRYLRPLWYEKARTAAMPNEIQGEKEEGAQ